MLAARQRIIDVRNERTEHLMRLRDYMRNVFKEFAANTDPISGARFADVSADGNKSRGDLSISATFFEGTKVSLGIDVYGRYVHSGNPVRVLGDIGTIVAIRVAQDLSRAQITYDTNTTPPRRRTIDVSALLDVLTETALKIVEAEVVVEAGDIPDVAQAPAAKIPLVASLAVGIVPEDASKTPLNFSLH